MSSPNLPSRRQILGGVAAVSLTAIVSDAASQAAPAHGKGAHPQGTPRAKAPSTALKAIVKTTADCLATGRVCLARCTDHLASGMHDMAECQRTVMNMLAATEAMGSIAGYANADAKLIAQLAAACAGFCRACAKACEPHAARHEECKACGDACIACAKACEALS